VEPEAVALEDLDFLLRVVSGDGEADHLDFESRLVEAS